MVTIRNKTGHLGSLPTHLPQGMFRAALISIVNCLKCFGKFERPPC